MRFNEFKQPGLTIDVPNSRTGKSVADVQKVLLLLGYSLPIHGVDGIRGPETVAAVKKFQQDNNLAVDGDPGTETVGKLNQLISDKSLKFTKSTDAEVKQHSQDIGPVVAVPGSDDAKAIKTVINAGAGFTDVQTVDGENLRRQGVRNWRNNNPGNIEYGPFARSKGAVGTDGRFAVFPTLEAGMKAKEDLVFGSSYINLTIHNAIAKYAPEHENDVNMYVGRVVAATGATPNTVLKDLSPTQRTAMLASINRVEGFKPGQVLALNTSAGTRTA